MKNIKRIISFVLIAAMAISLYACKSNEPDSVGESVGAETGAWAVNDQEIQAKLPDEVAKAFSKAMEGFTGIDLEPVAYVGSQVVAGMNYMILCRATAVSQESVPTYKMVIIYADLDGNAEITSLTDFDLAKYTEGEGKQDQEMLSGGWYVPEEACGSDIPEEVKAAYEEATEAVCWQWGTVDTIAYLGSQVVAGTNYAILCKGVLTEDSSSNRVFIVTVYKDLDGNVQFLNSRILDLTDFTE